MHSRNNGSGIETEADICRGQGEHPGPLISELIHSFQVTAKVIMLPLLQHLEVAGQMLVLKMRT